MTTVTHEAGAAQVATPGKTATATTVSRSSIFVWASIAVLATVISGVLFTMLLDQPRQFQDTAAFSAAVLEGVIAIAGAGVACYAAAKTLAAMRRVRRAARPATPKPQN